MAAGGKAARFNAVQIGNLLLLTDREVADEIGGPHFVFEPCAHGPYAAAVLETVERLAADGKTVIDRTSPYWVCFATEEGFGKGVDTLAGMNAPVRRYLRKAAQWILSQPFGAMMSGIFQRYPDMAVNSRIPRLAMQDPGRRRMHPFLAGMASVAGILRGRGRRQAGPQADAAALASDWWAVGDDIRHTLEHAGAPFGR